jgi:hypothetical protein
MLAGWVGFRLKSTLHYINASSRAPVAVHLINQSTEVLKLVLIIITMHTHREEL